VRPRGARPAWCGKVEPHPDHTARRVRGDWADEIRKGRHGKQRELGAFRCADDRDAAVDRSDVRLLAKPTQSRFDALERYVGQRRLRLTSAPVDERQHCEPFRHEQIQEVLRRAAVRSPEREDRWERAARV
jgi:hypothetical protein